MTEKNATPSHVESVAIVGLKKFKSQMKEKTMSEDNLFYYDKDDWRLFNPDKYLTINMEIKEYNFHNDGSTLGAYKAILDNFDIS